MLGDGAEIGRYTAGCFGSPRECARLARGIVTFWPALLLTGGIATAAAFFVQSYVQQRLSAVETGMIILTEPIFAAVFGQLLMGDRLSGPQIFGAVLMVAAVFATELVPLIRNARDCERP
jgi:drug/metabolite transporter (DMT)-like permease